MSRHLLGPNVPQRRAKAYLRHMLEVEDGLLPEADGLVLDRQGVEDVADTLQDYSLSAKWSVLVDSRLRRGA